MYCTSCGTKLPDGSAFCGACGKPTPQGPASTSDARKLTAEGSAAEDSLEKTQRYDPFAITPEPEHTAQVSIASFEKPRPWHRYLARMIDVALFGTIIGGVWFTIYPNSPPETDFILGLAVLLLWAFVEAALITLTGTTPGKWLINTRITDKSGSKPKFNESMLRSGQVYATGLGLGLPIVSLVTMILSFRHLTKFGHAEWDRSAGTVVVHKQMTRLKMGLTVVVVAALGVLFALGQSSTFLGTATTQNFGSRDQIASELDDLAQSDLVLSAFSTSFPDEWATMRTELVADIADTSIGAAELQMRATQLMRQFVASRALQSASAPSADLNRLVTTERDFIVALSEVDEALCARFGLSGLDGSESLSDNLYRLLSEVAVAKFNSIQSGQIRPEQHGEVTAGDVERLVAGMRTAGADDDTIALMLGDPATGSVAQQCSGSVALYRALEAMPNEQAARIYAAILRPANEG
jgi:hypothetical protein